MSQITEYGDEGFPSAYCLYDQDGKLTSCSELTCDEIGNIIKSEGGTNFEYVPNIFGDSACIVRYGADNVEINRTYYSYDVFGLYTGMINVIDGTEREVPYVSEYDFDPNGETLYVTLYYAETNTVAVEYELLFMPFQ